jgi:hypothetical protein
LQSTPSGGVDDAKKVARPKLPPWMEVPPEVEKWKRDLVRKRDLQRHLVGGKLVPVWKLKCELALKHNDTSSGAGREAANDALLALGLSLPPRGGKCDTEDAVKQILKLPKKSTERGAAIKLICKGGYISLSQAAFYKRIQGAENQKNGTTPQPKPNEVASLGLGYEGDFLQWDIRHVVKWKGSIVLSVIPACDAEQPTYGPLQTIDICSIIGNSDFASKRAAAAPAPWDSSPPWDPTKNWQEMCKKEGLTAVEYDRRKYENHRLSERITKLYFEPAKYPPPKGEWDDPDYIVFGYLKDYIQNAAELCGSPVVCNGGNYEARFQCRHWYRKIEGKERAEMPDLGPHVHVHKRRRRGQRSYNKHSCTFAFTVKWDRLGYYILINNKERSVPAVFPQCSRRMGHFPAKCTIAAVGGIAVRRK